MLFSLDVVVASGLEEGLHHHRIAALDELAREMIGSLRVAYFIAGFQKWLKL
jgi:hypothetical protein